MQSLRKISEINDFIGLNKGEHDGSICWIHDVNGKPEIQIFLKERITRKKRDGGSLLPVLGQLKSQIDLSKETFSMAESAVGLRPVDGCEHQFNLQFPFYEIIEKSGLRKFSVKYNETLEFRPHHFSHALGSAAISPFEKSLILVSDGMGSFANAFASDDPEILGFPPGKALPKNHQPAETISVYLQKGLSLQCVAKSWVVTPLDERFGPGSCEGLGLFYGACSQYVFGNGLEAGKLMGLAPFGRPQRILSRQKFIQSLPIRKAYRPIPGKAWGRKGLMHLYQEIAASAQQHFEESIIKIVRDLKSQFPDFENLILTGGTALNCVANSKIARLGLFKNIYVPPFPSDEGISFGLATWAQYHNRLSQWQPKSVESPLEFWGPNSSVPSEAEIQELFTGYKIERPQQLVEYVSDLLHSGEILAWFQGRSECGPRALGHRSILADPGIPDLQSYLNQKIKFREDFRPYGASCPLDQAREYFDLPDSVESPSMSFTANIHAQWKERLMAVSHIDGSSRIQTLRRSQEPLFYDLLKSFGKRSGYSVLLNTSLNGPGEPIVETAQDAQRFFQNSRVKGIVVGPFVILK